MTTSGGGRSAISSKDHFAFDAPTVANANPDIGSKAGGTHVTVTGSGFALGDATVFKFKSAPATSVDCTSTTECTMLAPPASTTGPVDVKATAGRKTSKKNPPADRFTYS